MILNRRNLILGGGSILVAQALPALAAGTQVLGGPAFGSWWRAVIPSSADGDEITTVIEDVIASVDGAMSPFRQTSEIGRFNALENENWHPVSVETAQVVAESLQIARLTGGAFDPTIGPIVGRFGFGPIEGTSPAGYSCIEIGKSKLRKTVADASLDLCGIAKGHALDRMADALAIHGIRSFMLEAGGELLSRGRHPDGRTWQAGIETPNADISGFQRIVTLDGMALATSGDSANGGQEGNVSFNHIINPQTERPVINGVASVSVIAKTAMRADALATAMFVMGSERGLALAEQEGISVMFLTREAAGISEKMSGQFARYIVV